MDSFLKKNYNILKTYHHSICFVKLEMYLDVNIRMEFLDTSISSRTSDIIYQPFMKFVGWTLLYPNIMNHRPISLFTWNALVNVLEDKLHFSSVYSTVSSNVPKSAKKEYQ